MKYQIRPYRKIDFDHVVELFRLNIPKYFDVTEEDGLINYLIKDNIYLYVAEQEGVILGVGGFDIIEDEGKGMLSWYFVHPSTYGRGIGTALVQKNLESIKESGVSNVVVRTSQFASRFFEKQGFELLYIKKDYWAKGYDLYYMELTL